MNRYEIGGKMTDDPEQIRAAVLFSNAVEEQLQRREPPPLTDEQIAVSHNEAMRNLVLEVAGKHALIAYLRKRCKQHVIQLERSIERILGTQREPTAARQDLEEWARAQIRPGKSSRSIMEGIFGFRHLEPKLTVIAPEQLLKFVEGQIAEARARYEAICAEGVDEEAADEWLLRLAQLELLIERRVNPALIDPSAWRVVDEETGEVRYDLPGTVVEDERTLFYISPGQFAKTMAAAKADEEDGDE